MICLLNLLWMIKHKTEGSTPMAKRYTNEQKRDLVGKINELLAANNTWHDIADIFNATGIKNAAGNNWTYSALSWFHSKHGRRFSKRPGKVGRPRIQVERTPDTLSKSTVHTILTDPNLTMQQAVKLLIAYSS